SEDVHERIAVIAGFKDALAADRRHTEAVAVVGNAGYYTLEDAPVARAGHRVVRTTEPQRIEHGDRPGAHRENIAQDATHAGGRLLKWFDKARVVVRFDLKRHHVSATDIDDARVLAGPLHHGLAASGQFLQVEARAFVRAVLAPHYAEDSEFGIARLAPENA